MRRCIFISKVSELLKFQKHYDGFFRPWLCCYRRDFSNVRIRVVSIVYFEEIHRNLREKIRNCTCLRTKRANGIFYRTQELSKVCEKLSRRFQENAEVWPIIAMVTMLRLESSMGIQNTLTNQILCMLLLLLYYCCTQYRYLLIYERLHETRLSLVYITTIIAIIDDARIVNKALN